MHVNIVRACDTMASRISARNRERAQKIKKHEQFERATESCRTGVDQYGFESRFINHYIGKGVFTKQDIRAGEYLLEYKGELLSNREARLREKQYDEDDKGSFMYFFRFKGKILCIDSTDDDMSIGRLVNDAALCDPKSNAEMKIVIANKSPHLCLFAIRDIKTDEELRFDYGVGNLPWRKHPNTDSTADCKNLIVVIKHDIKELRCEIIICKLNCTPRRKVSLLSVVAIGGHLGRHLGL